MLFEIKACLISFVIMFGNDLSVNSYSNPKFLVSHRFTAGNKNKLPLQQFPSIYRKLSTKLSSTVTPRIKKSTPKAESNILVSVFSKLWSITFGLFFSKIFQLIKIVLPNKDKSNTSNIDETIESIKEIAEQEKLEINEEREDNVISVTIANEFTDEVAYAPKTMDKKELAAARKIVERKLEELKNKTVTKPVSDITVTPALIENVVEIVPEVVVEVVPTVSSIVSTVVESVPETVTVPITVEAETVPIPPPAQDILNSFPAVVSEKSDDHTYMSYRFGAVDPHAVLENDSNNSADSTQNGVVSTSSGTSTAKNAVVKTVDDSWSKVKAAGRSGVIAYTLTELSFWAIAPILVVFYQALNSGAAINLSDSDQQTKIFSLSAGFLTFARLAVPARMALALSLIPFVEKNITGKLFSDIESSTGSVENASQDTVVSSTVAVGSVDGQQA